MSIIDGVLDGICYFKIDVRAAFGDGDSVEQLIFWRSSAPFDRALAPIFCCCGIDGERRTLIVLECSDVWPECGRLNRVAFGEAAEVKFNKRDDWCAASVNLVFGPVAIGTAVFFDRGVLGWVEGLTACHDFVAQVSVDTWSRP